MKLSVITLAYLVGLTILIGVAVFLSTNRKENVISPISFVKEKPLERYTFERLRSTQFPKSEILLGKVVQENSDVISQIFYLYVEGKKVSGLIHIPTKDGIYPIIVLFRGYIDQKTYKTGDGTRRVSESFAKNGFITLAPDFLGYGESASPSANPVEERLQTYTTALTLLDSLDNLNKALQESNVSIKANTKHIGIWGHSNGGQIALSVLAITGKGYPTVLWAPVTKPFPYSVLYYTDEFDDHGKMLRRVIAEFEKDYDVEKFSFTNYIDWINALIQLHQGENDDAVPKRWSDQFVDTMKEKKKDILYLTYPNDDHNLSKGGWQIAVDRGIIFYVENFTK